MNSFVNAVKNQEARTTNGMKALKSSASSCVDLFFKIGASRVRTLYQTLQVHLLRIETMLCVLHSGLVISVWVPVSVRSSVMFC